MQTSKYFFNLGSKIIQRNSLRTFTTSSIKYDSKSSAVDKVPESSPKTNQSSSSRMDIGVRLIRPSERDKTILVWVKRFPSKDKIPEKISVETLAQAQSKARIKVCNYMVVATIIGCFTAVMLGKRQREEGLDMNDIMMGKNAPYK